MKVTSMDISSKEFKRAIRGYNTDEVDEFLDKISEDYETLYKEHSSLKEKIYTMTEKVEHYGKMEDTIQNTLLLAQNAADQARQSAQKEAELIIRNANSSAQKILDKAHGDVLQINNEYEQMKQEFVKFRSKFRNFLNTQMDMFNGMEQDLIKNYNIGNIVGDVKEKEVESYEYKEESGIIEDFKIKNIKEEQFSDDMNAIKSFFAKSE